MYGIHRQSFFLNDLKFIHLKIDSKKNNYLITPYDLCKPKANSKSKKMIDDELYT